MRELDRAMTELDKLDWLTDQTLQSGKRRLLLEDARGLVYADKRADELGRCRWWLGDTHHALDRAERLGRVTRQDVEAAWRTHVRDAKRIRVYVKPERIPALIRLFGWLYPLFS
jgi:predicted Zn-dependent peptidase